MIFTKIHTCSFRYGPLLWWSSNFGQFDRFFNVDSRSKALGGGCGVKLGLVYAVIPRLSRYSMGLSEPRDILMRFSLYQRM